MPGQLDDWIRVPFILRPALDRLRLPRVPRDGAPPRSRRVLAIAALVSVLALVGAGTIAYGAVHKTVELDVDGTVTRVETFAGSVEGVLKDRGIAVSSRDTVAPEPASAVQDRSEIVVRHATLIQVEIDGAQQDVWTTALSAHEALSTLVTRGDDVRLVASRSAAGGRAELPIELTRDGPVDVAVDGSILTTDGSRGLAAALTALGITLTDLDRVSVQRERNAAVTVVVNRVVVQDVTEQQAISFTSTDAPDPSRYVGRSAISAVGVDGQRTIVNRITTVDGVETARELISDAVSVAPVNQVVSVGTRPRPTVVSPAPAAPTAGSGGAADSLNWGALAACESGGRVDAVSASGAYHGLYQFSVSTWNGVGGSGLPSDASADEQTLRAKALYSRSGAGQWPHCGPRLFG